MKLILLLLSTLFVIPVYAQNPTQHLLGWWTDGTEYFYFGPYSYVNRESGVFDFGALTDKAYVSVTGGRYVHGHRSSRKLFEGAYKVGGHKCGDLVTFQDSKHCCYSAKRIYKYLVMSYQAGGSDCHGNQTLLPVSKEGIKTIFQNFEYEQ